MSLWCHFVIAFALILAVQGVSGWMPISTSLPAGAACLSRRSSGTQLVLSATTNDDDEIATANQSVAGREKIKTDLLRLALIGGRGSWARPFESTQATTLLEQLEQQQQHDNARDEQAPQDGTWELILSDVEPFRASVFFLALAEAVEANLQPNASDGALTVHSLATGGGEIGRVAHVIEDNATRLHSLVELKSGSLPSLPLALTGTVISSGELESMNRNSEFSLSLKNTTVQESTINYGLPREGGLTPGQEPNMLKWIGDQLVPSGDIFASILDPLGGGQTALLKLSYADDDWMVWRTPNLGNHYFCFVRGNEDAWPAMQELRETQAQPSPIGSAFALGMLNPFFTRRAGIKK